MLNSRALPSRKCRAASGGSLRSKKNPNPTPTTLRHFPRCLPYRRSLISSCAVEEVAGVWLLAGEFLGSRRTCRPLKLIKIFDRLANLDHNLKVLLIEAGESNLNNPWVFRPGIFPQNMKLDSKTATFYESKPSKWLGGRGAIVPAAHVLGGGSSINFMV